MTGTAPELLRLSGSNQEYMLLRQVASFLQAPIDVAFPLLPKREILESDQLECAETKMTYTKVLSGDVLLCVEDVHQLMMENFKEKFIDYCKIVLDRKARECGEQRREYIPVGVRFVASESLLKSAAKYNSALNMKRNEHRSFFDINTLTIQQPMRYYVGCNGRFAVPNYPKPPIAKMSHLIIDNELAIGSLDNADAYCLLNLPQSPPAATVSNEEIMRELGENDVGSNATALKTLEARNGNSPLALNCKFCQQPIKEADCFVRCTKCRSCGHPQCMDMSDDMFSIVKTYDWMCMDCKPCSVCSQVDGDDKILFCDRCDRGYHTFCVGLRSPPTGPWICHSYCSQLNGADASLANDNDRRCSIGQSAQDGAGEICCEDCMSIMTKKELQKWRRRTIKDSILCSMCNHRRRFGD